MSNHERLTAQLRCCADTDQARATLLIRWRDPTGEIDWTPVESRATLAEILTGAANAIAALERELGEAREALQPFAERGRAEFTTGDFRNPEPAPESQIFGSELFLTVGDLRRATLVHARLSPSPSELAGDDLEEGVAHAAAKTE